MSLTGVEYWDAILYTDLESEGLEERPPYDHYSRIEACDVTQSAVDEFGPLASGSLTIYGLVVECILGRKVQIHEGEERIQHLLSFGDTVLPMNSDYLLDEEGPNKTTSGTTVFCLCMSMLQQGQKEYLVSLVLRKAPTAPNCFERIGTLRVTGPRNTIHPDSTIFRRAESRTVVVI